MLLEQRVQYRARKLIGTDVPNHFGLHTLLLCRRCVPYLDYAQFLFVDNCQQKA